MSAKYNRDSPEVLAYIEKELKKFHSGGDVHDAYVITRISGMGHHDLHTLEKPIVGFGQSNDPYYQQYLKNWDEVNALINQLKATAIEAWGENVSHRPMQSPVYSLNEKYKIDENGNMGF